MAARSGQPFSLVAVDTGGTFTDFFVLGPAGMRLHKVLSTPKDPSRAILQGLKELGLKKFELIHGSTVATNALLERKGARVLLLTTAGFEDVLEIGRQERPSLYELEVKRNPPLVGRALRWGIEERLDANGFVLKKLAPGQGRVILQRLRSGRVDSIAVCLLFSYANPRHERLLEKWLRPLKKPVSLSSQICPEYREYERCSTTCLNAYISPLMSAYLQRIAKKIPRLRIMQSNGGSLSVKEAGDEAVRTLLSGPAGGALGARRLATEAGIAKVLSFDMGGTSTDMSLINGELELTTESVVGGFPVKTPMLRIDTIGAGGGSLAWIDAGGALRVGPESAGSDPGPIAYGKGGRDMTLTDAHLFLGRIPPGFFLGGKMKLYPEKIAAPMKALAARLKLTPRQTAEGIIEIANAGMARALRVLSLQRGYDPREFTLLGFGGAGGLHACELAEMLAIREVLMPRHPGVLSAYGMAHADWVRDYVQTVLADPKETGLWRGALRTLKANALRDARAAGRQVAAIRWREQLDLRYRGQSYELAVPRRGNFIRSFEEAHRKRYGHLHRGQPIQVVNVRLQARIPGSGMVQIGKAAPAKHAPAKLLKIPLVWRKKQYEATLLRRDQLQPGDSIRGPAVLAEYSATIFLPPGWKGLVDRWGHLRLRGEG